jgi:hypothetical protein
MKSRISFKKTLSALFFLMLLLVLFSVSPAKVQANCASDQCCERYSYSTCDTQNPWGSCVSRSGTTYSNCDGVCCDIGTCYGGCVEIGGGDCGSGEKFYWCVSWTPQCEGCWCGSGVSPPSIAIIYPENEANLYVRRPAITARDLGGREYPHLGKFRILGGNYYNTVMASSSVDSCGPGDKNGWFYDAYPYPESERTWTSCISLPSRSEVDWIMDNMYLAQAKNMEDCLHNDCEGWLASDWADAYFNIISLDCAQNLQVECVPHPVSGAPQAYFSWDKIPEASAYILRLNREPFNDFVGPGDQRIVVGQPSWNRVSEYVLVEAGFNYQWSIQPVGPGVDPEPFWNHAGCMQAGPEFSCPGCAVCPDPATASATVEPSDISPRNCDIVLRWEDVDYDQGYRIYDLSWNLLATLASNVTTWTDAGVACRASAYTYRILPIRAPGCPALESWLCPAPSAVCSCPAVSPTPTPTRAPTPTPTRAPTPTPIRTPTPTPPPACPDCPDWVSATPVRLANGNCNINLAWEDVDNEDGYEIYRDRAYWTTVGRGVTTTVDTNLACRSDSYPYEVVPFSLAPGCPEPALFTCTPGWGACPCATPTPTSTATPTPTATPAPALGKIIGEVWERADCDCDCNDDNCNEPDPADWTVQCWGGSLGFNWVNAYQRNSSGFICCAEWTGSDCTSFDLDQGQQYSIRLNDPGSRIEPFCSPAALTVNLDSSQIDAGDFFICEAAEPWFQTEIGDTHTGENLICPIPISADDPYFCLEDGSIGGPGVVSYGGGSASFDPGGQVSTEGWLANDSYYHFYDFDYFYEKLGSPGSPNFNGSSPSTASGVYYASGPTTISAVGTWSLPSNTQISVLIDGELTIERNIDVPVGSYLGIFVSGDLAIDPSVNQIEGVFFSDRDFSTGDGDNQLVGEGVFVAADFDLGRDLTDNTDPAEIFRYRPDLIFNSPLSIWRVPQLWQELAP